MSLFFQALFTFIFAFFCINLSKKISLIDFPSKRKNHLNPTPLAGGMTIAMSLLFSLKFGEFDDYYLNSIIGYAILISLIGIADDKYNLTVGNKLALMTFAIFFLIKDGLIVDSLGIYDYVGELKLGTLQTVFTFLAVLLLINAFNYIDGLDGNCLGLFINGLIILFFLNNSNENLDDFIKHLVTISFITFLFNISFLKLPKFFLGDGGSLMLGFIASFLLIYSFKVLEIHPSKLIWCFNIIIFDFLSVNIDRFINNKNIFTASNDHIHHLLIKKFKSQNKTLIMIFFINTLLAMIGIYLAKINDIWSILFFIISFFSYFTLRKI